MVRHIGSLFIMLLVAFTLNLTNFGDAQEPKKEMTAKTVVKGKIPAGWQSLKLTPYQKSKLLETSADFQARIEDIRREEYRALFQLLDKHQKDMLADKANPK